MDTNEHTSWRLAIGDLFTPERTHWPDNRFELRYFDGSFLLQICEASPSEKSIAAFRHGAMHIGLHYEQGVIFFLFRIDGTWAWSDQAFSIHLVSEADRGPGEPSDNAFVPLTVVLVDSNTGRVAALRMVTMSPRFANMFNGFIDRQRATPFDPETHKRTIAALYTKYRHSKALAAAALIRERAGSNIV
jgi:hypothetical protein